jgi:hypothetical protein
MLSSSSLRKNKEVLARNGGGKIGKEMCLCIVLVAVIVALEHDTPLHHCIWVGKSICLSFDHPACPYVGSSLSQCCQDHCRVIHMFKRSLTLTSLLSSRPSAVINILPCRPSLCQFRITSYSDLPQICYIFRVIDGGYIKALL